MNAEELLRRYLEQRRELGEQELVLDGLSVEEVMRIIGATGERPQSGGPANGSPRDRERPAAPDEPPPLGSVREPPMSSGPMSSGFGGDWRSQLAASGGTTPPSGDPGARGSRSGGPDAHGSPPADSPPPGSSAPPSGLVVGGGEAELFGGPIGQAGSLEEIASLIERCTRCSLHETATHAVPGEGNPHAQVMCVGEAPGATEDETGRPFVGAAGQLLTKILAAINLKRDDVFITNVLKHRPPGNRNPLPDEVTACRPYLMRQVELIHPKVIIAFGTFAAQSLLETKLALGKLRGSVHRYHGIPVVVTYHPAALLRNPAWKRPTWEDVQLARRILDNAAA